MIYKDNKPADTGNNDGNSDQPRRRVYVETDTTRVIIDDQGLPEEQQETALRYMKKKLAPVDNLIQGLKKWASDDSDIEEAERIAGRKLSADEREGLDRCVMGIVGAPVFLPDGNVPLAQVFFTHGSTLNIAKALFNQMSVAPKLALIVIASAMYCFHKDENLEGIDIESTIETMREFIRRHEGKEGGR